MSTQKIKDLAVVVSSYQDQQTGNMRNKYKTIGHILQKDDGGKFMLLDPTMNLAALPRKSDMVMVSMFDSKENEQNNQQSPGQNNNQNAQPNQSVQYSNPDGSPMSPSQVQQQQQQG